MKINRIGLMLCSMHSVSVIFIGIIEAFFTKNEVNRGALFFMFGLLDKPAIFIAQEIFKTIMTNDNFFITMPIILFFVGGIQWYLIGWGIDKISQKAIK